MTQESPTKIFRLTQAMERAGLSHSTVCAKLKLNPKRPEGYAPTLPRSTALGIPAKGWIEAGIEAITSRMRGCSCIPRKSIWLVVMFFCASSCSTTIRVTEPQISDFQALQKAIVQNHEYVSEPPQSATPKEVENVCHALRKQHSQYTKLKNELGNRVRAQSDNLEGKIAFLSLMRPILIGLGATDMVRDMTTSNDDRMTEDVLTGVGRGELAYNALQYSFLSPNKRAQNQKQITLVNEMLHAFPVADYQPPIKCLQFFEDS